MAIGSFFKKYLFHTQFLGPMNLDELHPCCILFMQSILYTKAHNVNPEPSFCEAAIIITAPGWRTVLYQTGLHQPHCGAQCEPA